MNKKLLLAVVLAASTAHAADIDVAYGRGPRALSARTVRKLVRSSMREWSRVTGVPVRAARFTQYRAGALKVSEVFTLSQYGPADGLVWDRDALVILPPLIEDRRTSRDDAWIAGNSFVCGGIAHVAVTSKPRFRGNRLLHARVAIGHELGHLLGARHSDGIMHPAAMHELEGWGFRWWIEKQSVSEVKRCQR